MNNQIDSFILSQSTRMQTDGRVDKILTTNTTLALRCAMIKG